MVVSRTLLTAVIAPEESVHNGVLSLGWTLDYTRFRVWLREKYGVSRAYLFIGLIPKNKDLYLDNVIVATK